MAHKHLSLKEVAYKIIKGKILDGEFEPGSRIREDHLADEISMSRTPVREAINRLVSEGLVINKARKGLYLIDPSLEEVETFLDIRIALEKLSIEKCIKYIDEKGLKELYDSLDNFEADLKNKKFDECNKLDGDFHLMIAKFSGNKKLYQMLRELSLFLSLMRYWGKRVNPKEKNEGTLKEHRIIYQTIVDKDINAAKEAINLNINAMRNHLHLK